MPDISDVKNNPVMPPDPEIAKVMEAVKEKEERDKNKKQVQQGADLENRGDEGRGIQKDPDPDEQTEGDSDADVDPGKEEEEVAEPATIKDPPEQVIRDLENDGIIWNSDPSRCPHQGDAACRECYEEFTEGGETEDEIEGASASTPMDPNKPPSAGYASAPVPRQPAKPIPLPPMPAGTDAATFLQLLNGFSAVQENMVRRQMDLYDEMHVRANMKMFPPAPASPPPSKEDPMIGALVKGLMGSQGSGKKDNNAGGFVPW